VCLSSSEHIHRPLRVRQGDERRAPALLFLSSEGGADAAQLLDEHEARTGHRAPIDVDDTSGGLIAPFAHPMLQCDLKLLIVATIISAMFCQYCAEPSTAPSRIRAPPARRSS
jgi:hypothetical protein